MTQESNVAPGPLVSYTYTRFTFDHEYTGTKYQMESIALYLNMYKIIMIMQIYFILQNDWSDWNSKRYEYSTVV
jgi:hypothetical protein